jgi:hypothetical protein
MLSLLYVSRSRLQPLNADTGLRDILAAAALRNLRHGITGALVYTGSDFAQALEGPEEAVSHIMASILIDKRHDQVSIVRRDEAELRSFPNWGMALVGHVPDTQRQIEAIWASASERSLDDAVSGLVRWMREGASAQVA